MNRNTIKVDHLIFDEDRGRLTIVLPGGGRVETQADIRPMAAAIVRAKVLENQL